MATKTSRREMTPQEMVSMSRMLSQVQTSLETGKGDISTAKIQMITHIPETDYSKKKKTKPNGEDDGEGGIH